MEAATILGFDEPGMFQTTGTVSASSDGRFEVASAEGTLRAGRAVSCLVEPEEGDLVLVAGPRSGDLFVLAVLERPGEGEARITSDRDVSIELGSGRLRLVAARGIELLTSSVLTAAAATIEARATDGSAFFKGARLVAATVDTVVERVAQNIKRSYRHIEELDYVRSAEIDYAAQDLLRLHGEHSLVTAEKIVKAEAAQIHLG